MAGVKISQLTKYNEVLKYYENPSLKSLKQTQITFESIKDANGNVLTDKVYYSDLKDEYIAFNEEPIEIDYINNLKSIADKALDVSNAIVVHDLIKREASRIGECVNE